MQQCSGGMTDNCIKPANTIIANLFYYKLSMLQFYDFYVKFL